jgi:hypothetical protein
MFLELLPAEANFFTCLDLKDGFFCIHLVPSSQPIFAFQWEKSQYWRKGATNLDSIATSFQKFAYYFQNCLGIQPQSFLSQLAHLHTPPGHR